jgi:pyruvate dehydrogenase E1 component alpha subunit
MDWETPYQILDPEGRIVSTPAPKLPAEQLLNWYKMMWYIRKFSHKIVALQRQGKATTWGPLDGHEATSIGMAAPLQPQDWLTGSYRDTGAYIMKGLPAEVITYYQRGFPPDFMPKEARCLPIQIVLSTQMLHAVGLAMAAKIKGDNAVVVGACGDGATSEGDFNEALNFAGVFQAPVVLVVVNNQWAISVPRRKQSAAKSFAARGEGFGIPSKLVDGNDIFAVYSTVKEAVDKARNGGGPTLIEALTYRLGAHTTADDPTRYVPSQELAEWKGKDPVLRFREYLLERNVADEGKLEQLISEVEEEINTMATETHARPTQTPDNIFDFVYAKRTPRLDRQRAEMLADLAAQKGAVGA